MPLTSRSSTPNTSTTTTTTSTTPYQVAPPKYTLNQTNNILLLALAEIHPEKGYFMRGPHDEALAEELKKEMLPHLQRSANSLEKLKKLKLQVQRDQEKSLFQTKKRKEDLNLVWGFLIKESFQNGEILSVHYPVLISWRVYLENLKVILKKNETTKKEGMSAKSIFQLQTYFIEFVGQLTRFGYRKQAQAIHNFVHTIRHVAKVRIQAGCDKKEDVIGHLAYFAGPCLLYGLNLVGKIGHISKEYPDLKVFEFNLIVKLAYALLKSEHFDVDYTKAGYTNRWQRGVSLDDPKKSWELFAAAPLNTLIAPRLEQSNDNHPADELESTKVNKPKKKSFFNFFSSSTKKNKNAPVPQTIEPEPSNEPPLPNMEALVEEMDDLALSVQSDMGRAFDSTLPMGEKERPLAKNRLPPRNKKIALDDSMSRSMDNLHSPQKQLTDEDRIKLASTSERALKGLEEYSNYTSETFTPQFQSTTSPNIVVNDAKTMSGFSMPDSNSTLNLSR